MVYRSAINLEALRASALQDPSGDRLPWIEQPLSRRRVLGIAGAAGLGAAPVVRLAHALTLGDVELVEGPGRIALRIAGLDLWVIDTRWFAGSPALRVVREQDHVHITLRGARFAGTPLPADLTCDLRRALRGWRISIVLALGGFS
ncbi:MAG: putative outer rane channel, partial [Chloroflexi bacterium]|nr:putative outer rane channel [Chloroflexota bacterium]